MAPENDKVLISGAKHDNLLDMRFIGRKREREGLRSLLKKKTASLVVIRGRRRIGKSRLCEEFAKEFEHSYFFSGLPPSVNTTSGEQKKEFYRQMREQDIPCLLDPDDWGNLFTSVARYCAKGRILVVLDEITWMGSKAPTFLGKLKTAWDHHFKKNCQLILIISGSNSAWIEKNILSSTGFVGRISWRIALEELPLLDCSQFWRTHQSLVSAYEKLKVLAVTGGVPRYLEEIDPAESAESNILRLAFRPEGLLVHEFENVFSDLFDRRSGQYRKIVRSVVAGPLTPADLAKSLGRARGGDLSENLEELCEAGFLSRDHAWNLRDAKKSRLNRVRLRDNYVRFYLKYVEPRKESILRGEISQLPQGWLSMIGLQFENLVLSNRRKLHSLLRIPEQEFITGNPYFQKKTKRHPACQIDYLVQTRFSTLFLCEVKFQRDSVGCEVISEVQKKVTSLEHPRGFSIRPVLIHVNGVTDELLDRAFFSHIIDFSQLLDSDSEY